MGILSRDEEFNCEPTKIMTSAPEKKTKGRSIDRVKEGKEVTQQRILISSVPMGLKEEYKDLIEQTNNNRDRNKSLMPCRLGVARVGEVTMVMTPELERICRKAKRRVIINKVVKNTKMFFKKVSGYNAYRAKEAKRIIREDTNKMICCFLEKEKQEFDNHGSLEESLIKFVSFIVSWKNWRTMINKERTKRDVRRYMLGLVDDRSRRLSNSLLLDFYEWKTSRPF
jgi:hypothetical protein